MIRFIKNLINGILAFLGGLLRFGKKPQLEAATAQNSASEDNKPNVIEEAKKAQEQIPDIQEKNRQALIESYFLDPEEATSQKKARSKPAATAQMEKPAATAQMEKPATAVKTESPANPTDAPTSAPESAVTSGDTASALNIPEPKVTSYASFSNFGDRRRPGANMNSFLEMARKMKTAG